MVKVLIWSQLAHLVSTKKVLSECESIAKQKSLFRYQNVCIGVFHSFCAKSSFYFIMTNSYNNIAKIGSLKFLRISWIHHQYDQYDYCDAFKKEFLIFLDLFEIRLAVCFMLVCPFLSRDSINTFLLFLTIRM